MYQITIDNIRNTRDGEICDRSSVLGNPFPMAVRSAKERQKVIDAYRRYLHVITIGERTPEQAINRTVRWYHERSEFLISSSMERPKRPAVMAELLRLEGIARVRDLRLLCWCHPLPCHCDILARYLRYRLDLQVAESGERLELLPCR